MSTATLTPAGFDDDSDFNKIAAHYDDETTEPARRRVRRHLGVLSDAEAIDRSLNIYRHRTSERRD